MTPLSITRGMRVHSTLCNTRDRRTTEHSLQMFNVRVHTGTTYDL